MCDIVHLRWRVLNNNWQSTSSTVVCKAACMSNVFKAFQSCSYCWIMSRVKILNISMFEMLWAPSHDLLWFTDRLFCCSYSILCVCSKPAAQTRTPGEKLVPPKLVAFTWMCTANLCVFCSASARVDPFCWINTPFLCVLCLCSQSRFTENIQSMTTAWAAGSIH